MRRTRYFVAATVVALASVIVFIATDRVTFAQRPQSESIDIEIDESPNVPRADDKSRAIVDAARAFLATLDDAQREAAMFEFTDNAQRANWSNLPEGVVRRDGVRLGELSATQRASLDGLLAEIMSSTGFRNVAYQLAADDMLDTGGGGRPNFGSNYFFASFLGEPSTTEPWMFQFGGHHLALNVTVFGPDITFSPMLTGGQPTHINFEGREVFITEAEATAAQVFMNSLTDSQREIAVRGRRAINLLLGPGKYGTVIAPEGIKGSDLTNRQKDLLLDVIAARLSFINDDDYAVKQGVAEADIDDTYFAWWGPEEPLGAAYFRVTGPSLVLEYAPQRLGGDPTDHVHNIYRDPGNDYGVAWVGARQ